MPAVQCAKCQGYFLDTADYETHLSNPKYCNPNWNGSFDDELTSENAVPGVEYDPPISTDDDEPVSPAYVNAKQRPFPFDEADEAIKGTVGEPVSLTDAEPTSEEGSKAEPTSTKRKLTSKAADPNDEFAPPVPTSGYYMDVKTRDFIQAALDRSEQGSFENLLLIGPAGTGKTSLIYQMAALNGRPFAKIAPQVLADASQLFGRRAVTNASTHYEMGVFTRAIERTGCIVLLDDLPHVKSPAVLAGLNSILDDTRECFLDLIDRWVRVAPGVVFVGTGNPPTAEYTAVRQMDAALLSRFEGRILELPALTDDKIVSILMKRTGIDRMDAKRMVSANKAVDSSRQMGLRGLIAISINIASGISFYDSWRIGATGLLSPADTQALLNEIQRGAPLTSEEISEANPVPVFELLS